VTTASGWLARPSPSPNLRDRNVGDGLVAAELNLAVIGQNDAKQALDTAASDLSSRPASRSSAKFGRAVGPDAIPSRDARRMSHARNDRGRRSAGVP